jgi:DNA-binding MarR family transcriptional regulator
MSTATLAEVVNSRRPGQKSPADRSTYIVKQLEVRLRSLIERAIVDSGLTPLQFIVLDSIRAEPGMSGADLARQSQVSPQAASEMIASLEAKELLVRVPRADNRRVLQIRLTTEGKKKLVECDKAINPIDEQMHAGLTAEESALLPLLLRKCISALEEADS